MKKHFLLIFFILVSFSIFAQIPLEDYPQFSESVAKNEGGFYDIQLAVIGPDKPIYSNWGHIAVLVKNRKLDTFYSYDYGVFNMYDKDFTKKFLRGRMDYLCYKNYADYTMPVYTIENRDVYIVNLDLTNKEKYVVAKYLENNAKPVNNIYKYKFFKNNCSTKIRDILDMATNGQIFDKSQDKTKMTIREHTFRYTTKKFFSEWFLDYIMGTPLNHIASYWEVMFLPNEVLNFLEDFKYIDSNGNYKKIVASIEIVNYGIGKTVIEEEPSPSWILAILLGIVVGAVGAVLFLFSSLKKGVRIVSGMYLFVLSLVLTFFFGISIYVQLFTELDCTYGNLGFVYINPLVIALLIDSIFFAVGAKKSRGTALILLGVMSLVSIVMLILGLLGVYQQYEFTNLLTVLPIYLLMFLGLVFAIEEGKPVKVKKIKKSK